jgi:hypothetical protein
MFKSPLVASLGAFVLLENKEVLNYARACAILPHSGNPCQVDFPKSDPKPLQRQQIAEFC